MQKLSKKIIYLIASLLFSGCSTVPYDVNDPMEKQISDLKQYTSTLEFDTIKSKAFYSQYYRSLLARQTDCSDNIKTYKEILEKSYHKNRYIAPENISATEATLACIKKSPESISTEDILVAYTSTLIYYCAKAGRIINTITDEELIKITKNQTNESNTRQSTEKLKSILSNHCGFYEDGTKVYMENRAGGFNYADVQKETYIAQEYGKLMQEIERAHLTLFLPTAHAMQKGQIAKLEFSTESLNDKNAADRAMALANTVSPIVNATNTVSMQTSVSQNTTNKSNKEVLLESYTNYILGDSDTPFAESVRTFVNTYNTAQLNKKSKVGTVANTSTNLSPQCQQMINNIKLPIMPTSGGPAACPAFQAKAKLYAQIADVASRCATPAEAADARRAANEAAQAAQQFCGDTSSYPARQSYSPPSTPRPAKPAAPEAKTECQPDLIGSKCPRN